MSEEQKHELEKMIDQLIVRDRNAVNDMNYFGGGASIENRISLADGRALDAMAMCIDLAKYIMKKERGE